MRGDTYKQSYNLGGIIKINTNGNLGDYSIEGIDGGGCYVTLSLKRD